MTNTTTALFDRHAADYNAARRRLIPPYDAFYGTAVDAVTLADGPEHILDLGAGTGLLSAHVRTRYPQAQLTLTDGSTEMLAQARHLLGAQGVRYEVGDLAGVIS